MGLSKIQVDFHTIQMAGSSLDLPAFLILKSQSGKILYPLLIPVTIPTIAHRPAHVISPITNPRKTGLA